MPTAVGHGSCSRPCFISCRGLPQAPGHVESGREAGVAGQAAESGCDGDDLCAAVFDWAKFRTTKGAVKLHLLLDHDGYLPCYAVVTEGKIHEIQVARKRRLQSGTMLVFDRGYTDYEWFRRLTEEEVHFVTRLKDNAAFLVVERRSPEGKGIRGNKIIAMEKQAQADIETVLLRRVRYWDETTQRELVSDQSFGVAGCHDRRHIQGTLADRTALQELDMAHSFGCYVISRINCGESTVGGVAGCFRSATHRSTSALRTRKLEGSPAEFGQSFAEKSFAPDRLGVAMNSAHATTLSALLCAACLLPGPDEKDPSPEPGP